MLNSQRSSQLASQDTLYTLASETGGKSFFDSNDIALGIARTQEAMGSYYLLGYYSTNNAADGKYRKISVKLNNPKLAAKLEHREGYYADKVWGKLNAQDKEQQLKEALSAGDPGTDLPLALQIDYFRISPTAYLVPVSIKIPGSVVALAAKGGAATTQFDFAGQIQDERRAVVGNVRDKIEIKLNAATVATSVTTPAAPGTRPPRPRPTAKAAAPATPVTAARKSFQYDAGFTLEPGKYHMKFVVRENITGKMGTFESRFTVPDLSADTSGLKLSTVIWSNQREPVKAAVGSAERLSRKEVRANPLIVGDHKVVPNITHIFRRNQSLYVNFDVYDALPDPGESQGPPRESQHELLQQEGREDFRSRSAGRHPTGGHAAGSRAGADRSAAEERGPRRVRLPDQRGGRGGPQVRLPARSDHHRAIAGRVQWAHAPRCQPDPALPPAPQRAGAVRHDAAFAGSGHFAGQPRETGPPRGGPL